MLKHVKPHLIVVPGFIFPSTRSAGARTFRAPYAPSHSCFQSHAGLILSVVDGGESGDLGTPGSSRKALVSLRNTGRQRG